ncbi:hypothetical protein [Kitasatospora sp. NPDC057223]|uniref:hypothetical protein n=1 Tax=Kitasatospora sp. NPDC057223 TaxID=3346055 RepID=UPI0036280A91
MTALNPFHIRTPIRTSIRCARADGPAHLLLTGILRRLADSPLDNTVLWALGGPSSTRGDSPHRPAVPLQASWRPVVGADGRQRLEARWRPEH